MENAVDALKIAFAVMVFTMALSLAMVMFSQAKETLTHKIHPYIIRIKILKKIS